ncbi:hypothetical protein [Bacillus cytotoxicus]|uniref:hypothetical protein n=1 Tax=Bacillus cytotoxicus TaxID=580165 RepID=UPI000B35D453|nr:hypothetical protein [Bacillus cytotoxicus]AWC29029.1 hypothetical protein CG483_012270 [Bacillus cytotoxicus]AWC39585.1 hypothetical protein CG480_002980 [Bacillus cytotoxicus]AWC47516.1 hypothetical protein CG478_002980 [Bacillus cytotoxicus]AWC53100.1 hypothetical protein CG477_012230 [Bacillus cytotoxicus]AWC57229.1 hypothetical protein CG476_012255 [Bacillus cytotoxicus]
MVNNLLKNSIIVEGRSEKRKDYGFLLNYRKVLSGLVAAGILFSGFTSAEASSEGVNNLSNQDKELLEKAWKVSEETAFKQEKEVLSQMKKDGYSIKNSPMLNQEVERLKEENPEKHEYLSNLTKSNKINNKGLKQQSSIANTSPYYGDALGSAGDILFKYLGISAWSYSYCRLG